MHSSHSYPSVSHTDVLSCTSCVFILENIQLETLKKWMFVWCEKLSHFHIVCTHYVYMQILHLMFKSFGIKLSEPLLASEKSLSQSFHHHFASQVPHIYSWGRSMACWRCYLFNTMFLKHPCRVIKLQTCIRHAPCTFSGQGLVI